MRKLISIGLVAVLVLFLLVGASEMPKYGSPDNPAHNEVMEHYITKGVQETGAVNLVAGMILDYRAFDTFVEATVLFTALMTLLLVLKKEVKEND